MLQALLVLCLLLTGLAAVPAWPYSRSWGYFPSGMIGAIVLLLVTILAVGAV